MVPSVMKCKSKHPTEISEADGTRSMCPIDVAVEVDVVADEVVDAVVVAVADGVLVAGPGVATEILGAGPPDTEISKDGTLNDTLASE